MLSIVKEGDASFDAKVAVCAVSERRLAVSDVDSQAPSGCDFRPGGSHRDVKHFTEEMRKELFKELDFQSCMVGMRHERRQF